MGFSIFTPSNCHHSSTNSLPQTYHFKRQKLHNSKSRSLPKNLRFPEYIYQTTTGLLIFRMKVPRDCRPQVGKKELHYSLRTHCIYSARKHIASLLPLLQDLFDGMRQGVYSDLSQADISHSLKESIHRAISRPLSFQPLAKIHADNGVQYLNSMATSAAQQVLPPPAGLLPKTPAGIQLVVPNLLCGCAFLEEEYNSLHSSTKEGSTRTIQNRMELAVLKEFLPET